MKKLTFIANMYLGMDCSFASRESFEPFEVELEDEDAAKIEAAVEGKEKLTKDEIEELCPKAAETIDDKARVVKHDLCVVHGWEEFGQEACGKDFYELFEEDLKSGEFSFTPEDSEDMDEDDIYQAQFDAWWDAETEKMNAMSLHELAEYLQDYYDLDTDSGTVYYDYEYLNPKM